MKPAAVFDLDGTLLPATSAERLLVPYLVKIGLVGAHQLTAALKTLATLPLHGFHRAVRANKRYVEGVSAEDLARAMGEFVERVLVPRICPAVFGRLECLSARGYTTCLLTGAPEPVARAVVSRLGMTDGLGTALETDRGRLTGHIHGLHYFGSAKRAGVADLAALHDMDLGGSVAFADHPSDVAFLECFGHPVAVRAGRSLRRLALRRGWELLDP